MDFDTAATGTFLVHRPIEALVVPIKHYAPYKCTVISLFSFTGPSSSLVKTLASLP